MRVLDFEMERVDVIHLFISFPLFCTSLDTFKWIGVPINRIHYRRICNDIHESLLVFNGIYPYRS